MIWGENRRKRCGTCKDGGVSLWGEKKKEKKKKNVYLYNEMIKPPGRVNCRLWNRNEALECLADEDEG